MSVPSDDTDANAPPPDGAASDSSNPASCLEWTHAYYFDPCAVPEAADDLIIESQLSPYILDTTSGTLTTADGQAIDITTAVLDAEGQGSPMRVVSAASVVVEPGAFLRVRGNMPAIIASWSYLLVEGTINANSTRAEGEGAGANPPACMESGAQPGIPTGGRGDGGGGGAFAAPGGYGGVASGNGAPGGSPVPLPGNLRGGCPGAEGAPGDQFDGNQGAGGNGGGAFHLSAMEEVRIAGTLIAGGAGGGGGLAAHGGGGGGGSGGLIGLAAPVVVAGGTSILAANGGGGGGGGGGSSPANAGQNSVGGPEPAAGGDGPNGIGGAGGFVDVPPGGDGEGGGGGGGSVGYIVVFAAESAIESGAIVSPAPSFP